MYDKHDGGTLTLASLFVCHWYNTIAWSGWMCVCAMHDVWVSEDKASYYKSACMLCRKRLLWLRGSPSRYIDIYILFEEWT